MEPEDLPLHDLLDTNQAATPDALRAIVARAGRQRVRFASMAAAAALVVGGGAGGAIGYASSNHSNHAVQTATAPETSNAAAGPNVSSGASGSGGSSGAVTGTFGSGLGSTKLTHQFTRTANGVDIRGYQLPSPALPPVMTRCSIFTAPRFQAEVSTANAVGTVASGFAATSTTSAVKSVSSDVIGLGEGDPSGVVVASTSSAVKSVKVSFTGGASDEMAPSGGWVALAGPVPASAVKGTTTVRPQVGTLTAYDGSGKQVFSQSVSIGFAGIGTGVPQPALCGCGGPIRGSAPVSPPNMVSPGLPTTKNASAPPAPATSPGFACPVIQGTAGSGSGSASSGSAVNG